MLSLGLFYHLTHQEDRLRAAIALDRVLSSREPAFVAYLPRTTLLRCLVARTADAGEWHQGELCKGLMKRGDSISRVAEDLPAEG